MRDAELRDDIAVLRTRCVAPSRRWDEQSGACTPLCWRRRLRRRALRFHAVSHRIAECADRRDRRGRNRWRATRAVAIAVTVSVGAAGCTDEGSQPASSVDSPLIDAYAYSAVVAGFLPPDGDEERRPVVWIVPLGAEPIPLDVQVDMIATVETTHDLRFVDDPNAALGDDLGTPRDDGVILGIGEIRSEAPHTVRAEVFVDQDVVRAERVTLVEDDGVWEIGSRELIDPEDLVIDE